MYPSHYLHASHWLRKLRWALHPFTNRTGDRGTSRGLLQLALEARACFCSGSFSECRCPYCLLLPGGSTPASSLADGWLRTCPSSSFPSTRVYLLGFSLLPRRPGLPLLLLSATASSLPVCSGAAVPLLPGPSPQLGSTCRCCSRQSSAVPANPSSHVASAILNSLVLLFSLSLLFP